MASYNWPPRPASGGAGIASINGDTTSAQLITGSNNISASTAGGTTTVNGALLAPKASPNFTGTMKYGNYVLNPAETGDTVIGAAVTCDLSVANAHSFTVVANTTITLSNFQAGGISIIRIIQDATGGWTYTWAASGRTFKWPSGVTPIGSGANKIDVAQFYDDGTFLYGSFSGNY